MAESQDKWSAADYQHSASFVPKLATKVVSWLDLQPDDVLLDVGCGDGILNEEFAKILAKGTGRQHGIDSSADMIASARSLCKDFPRSTFQVADANEFQPPNPPEYTKVFSNAALHWILPRGPGSSSSSTTTSPLFRNLHAALRPGGTLTFEMGGHSNVLEMHTALLMAVGRRVGHAAALAADPWCFPTEEWARAQLEGAGFRVDRLEREWRPTKADKGGVEGWLRLFGKPLYECVQGDEEREKVIRECVDVLEEVCADGQGGFVINYTRLRCQATKV